jgi:hypothetical protein
MIDAKFGSPILISLNWSLKSNIGRIMLCFVYSILLRKYRNTKIVQARVRPKIEKWKSKVYNNCNPRRKLVRTSRPGNYKY